MSDKEFVKALPPMERVCYWMGGIRKVKVLKCRFSEVIYYRVIWWNPLVVLLFLLTVPSFGIIQGMGYLKNYFLQNYTDITDTHAVNVYRNKSQEEGK